MNNTNKEVEIDRSSKERQTRDEEQKLTNLICRDSFAPGILDLYNAIQKDILKYLSSISNVAMNASSSDDASIQTRSSPLPDLVRSPPTWQTFSESVSATSKNNINDRVSNNSLIDKLSSEETKDRSEPCKLENESSYNLLPKIDSSNRFLNW